MSFGRDASALLRRVDVRVGVGLAAIIGLLLVGLMALFFLIATHETAELVAESIAPELKAVAEEIWTGATGEAAARQAKRRGVQAVRRVTAQGDVSILAGSWPLVGALYGKRTPSIRLAFASPSDHWVQGIRLPNGDRLEAAASLRSFVGERREQLAQIGVSLAVGLLGLIAASIAATRQALRPLRGATLAVEGIDERNLHARLAVRGTHDDLDRHARALNHVLARLEQAFARISAFSADVAHELRTPLNRILNLTDVALLESADREPPAALIAVRESVEEMRRTIDDLLLLARAEDGKLAVRSQPVDLARLLGSLRDLYAPVCDERSVALELDGPAAGPLAWTDPQLLEHAVSNLIDNAIRHTPENGRIEIAALPRGGFAEIQVRDSGPGIPTSDRDRVFDRFVQLDPARSGSGAGLGLSLARTIARLLGGDARVEDSALGGAALVVTIRTDPPAGPA
ncbi:MAG TPA: ATP-binding protein [Myxococcota bacterium]|jgi:signal transduction histidine kinase